MHVLLCQEQQYDSLCCAGKPLPQTTQAIQQSQEKSDKATGRPAGQVQGGPQPGQPQQWSQQGASIAPHHGIQLQQGSHQGGQQGNYQGFQQGGEQGGYQGSHQPQPQHQADAPEHHAAWWQQQLQQGMEDTRPQHYIWPGPGMQVNAVGFIKPPLLPHESVMLDKHSLQCCYPPPNHFPGPSEHSAWHHTAAGSSQLSLCHVEPPCYPLPPETVMPITIP